MKIKKAIAVLTAMTALMGTVVSCGTDEAESNSSSEASIKVSEEEITTAEESKETTEETTTTATEKEETTTSSEEEEAEEMTKEKAFELCKEAIEAYVAVEDGDVSETATDEFFRTNNAVLYYWVSEGELYSEDEIRDVLIENADNAVTSIFDLDLVEWESAEELDEEALTEWKDSITEMVKKSIDVKDEFDFENVESVWAVNASEKTDETSEAETPDVDAFDFENPIFYVVKYNGEWKADLVTSMLMQINQLFDGTSEVEVEEITDDEVNTATDETDETTTKADKTFDME